MLKGAERRSVGAAVAAMPELPAFLDNLQAPWAAASISAQDGSFVVDAATPAPDGAGSGEDRRVEAAVGPARRRRWRSSRATTWARPSRRAKALLAKEPSLADGVKQVDDTLALLGGFGAIVDWMGEVGIAVTVDGDKVAGGIVVTPLDPAAPGRLFTSCAGFLQLAGGSSGIKVTEETYAGATIVVIDLGDLGSSGRCGRGRACRRPANIQIAYAVTDEVVVLGYGTDFVKAVLDARTGDSLAKTDRFSRGAQAGGQGQRRAPVARRRGRPDLRRDRRSPRATRPPYEADAKPYLDAVRQRDRHLRARRDARPGPRSSSAPAAS